MMVDCAMAQLELQQERLAMDMDEASGQKSAVLDVLKLRMVSAGMGKRTRQPGLRDRGYAGPCTIPLWGPRAPAGCGVAVRASHPIRWPGAPTRIQPTPPQAAMDHTLTEFQHDSALLSGPEAADKLRRYHLLHTWRLSDASDIQAEVARFKQHAQQVLRQLTRQRREGDGKLHALSQRVRAELSVEDAQMLEAHLEVLFAATEEVGCWVQEG